MYRIRFHGRGGQGMKTGSRILGTAFFLEGFEVQDAPRYGAERRGAPIFAYVRASKKPILERGIISCPGLVILSDDTLALLPAAGVMDGVTDQSILLINSKTQAKTWADRLDFKGIIVMLPPTKNISDSQRLKVIGALCAAGTAALTGVISLDSLLSAVDQELSAMRKEVKAKNKDLAGEIFERMAEHKGIFQEQDDTPFTPARPEWIDLDFEPAKVSAPAIHEPATSRNMATGLWRTVRPVIDREKCNRCWWICSTLCPDSVISVREDGSPEIDLEHCKGCMICASQCPAKAIGAVAESEAEIRKQGEKS